MRKEMAKRVKYIIFVCFFNVVLFVLDVSLTENSYVGTRESSGIEIKCGEVEVSITVNRVFFEKKRVPFKPEHLWLGANSTQKRCGAKGPAAGSDMVISAGLKDCGTESRVHGDWLVYYNQLVLTPAAVPSSTDSLIVRRATTVIPIECHYRRKQTVSGAPLTPTWQPMTSTISVFGLLHFSLRTMAVIHVLLLWDRCLMDSVLPGSSSKFIPKQDTRLCFSFQAFHFNKETVEQMFISCHIRATLKQKSHSHRDKACFFHRPTFSWRATEGDDARCGCCDSDDCNTGHTTQLYTGEKHEADTAVGPLLTLPRTHWTGRLSLNH
ncbi:zona pellucida sperm-binding protein 3-like isoform X2 [Eleginops maclovinus]|uniref:zona pellucida sperm-binding protein 3-like isoform X2 n=1 Tax=Eleginops maclovinus TaxID=56733 RepID=UPI0030804529